MAVVLIAVSIFVPPLAAAIAGPSAITVGWGATALATGIVTFGAHAVASAIGSASRMTTFSWRNSAAQGIAAGLTAGLAVKLGGTTAELIKNSAGIGKIAASAVGGALSNYAGNAIAGVKGNSFSWTAIAAASVADVATASIGNALGLVPKMVDGVKTTGNFGTDFAYSAIGGVVSLHTRRQFGFDDKVDYGAILGNAFATATGNAIGGQINDALSIRNMNPEQRQSYESSRAGGFSKGQSIAYAMDTGGLRSMGSEWFGLGEDSQSIEDLQNPAALVAEYGAEIIRMSPKLASNDNVAIGGSSTFVDPMWVLNSVDPTSAQGMTKEVLSRAKWSMRQGDRAGAYLALYGATGQEQLLLQAQITTYSGAVGGAALYGNYLAKSVNPELYNLSLDQFSIDILRATINLYAKGLKDGFVVTADQLQTSDRQVWIDNKMGAYFPGNIQLVDSSLTSSEARGASGSVGTINAGFALLNGAELGKRPAEYAGNANYETRVGKRFIQVVNRSTGVTEVFWDKKPSLMFGVPRTELQIANIKLNSDSYASNFRAHAYEFLQANQPSVQTYNSRTWLSHKPLPSPNLYGNYFYNKSASQWQSSRDYSLGGIGLFNIKQDISPASQIKFNQYRNEIIQVRQRLGFPAEPQNLNGH